MYDVGDKWPVSATYHKCENSAVVTSLLRSCWQVLASVGRCWQVLAGVGRCWQIQVVWICFVCYSVKSKRCGWTRGCTPISSTPTCHWWVYTTLRISFITICAFLMLLAVIYVPPFFSYYLIYFLFYPHGCIKFECYHLYICIFMEKETVYINNKPKNFHFVPYLNLCAQLTCVKLNVL